MKCSYCKMNSNYLCVICEKHVCSSHSKMKIICDSHVQSRSNVKVDVREASEKDMEALDDMEDTILEHEGYEGDDETWEKLWKGIDKKTLVASVGRKIVGFLEYCKTLDPHERVSFSTADFVVNPEFQGLKVGKSLFEFLKKKAKSDGINRIYASTAANNLPAIIFHLKNGADIQDIESIGKSVERWGIKTDKSISFVYLI